MINNPSVFFPNYFKGISKSYNTVLKAEKNGWLYVANNSLNSEVRVMASKKEDFSNPVLISHDLHSGQYSPSTSHLLPIKAGIFYKGYGGNSGADFRFFEV